MHQNSLTLMHLRTYRSFSDRCRANACVRASAAARRSARVSAPTTVPAINWLSRDIRTIINAAVVTATQHGGTVSGCSVSLCAHARLNLLHADWLAGGPGDYKSEQRQYVRSLVGAREDDMIYWEPDE